ncbi:somatostatin-like receptor F_48D10.1 [Ptychodera flava]|uniref:somatostatin-like receptor F_48D10.1 n=1 Tax=Ptychodera flava TaxID=63121 RepID=UPI00396A2A60
MSLNITGKNEGLSVGGHAYHAVIIALILLGIFGNTCYLFVIVRVREMRTITNYYLLNLSVADTIFLSSELVYIVFAYGGFTVNDTLMCFISFTSVFVTTEESCIMITVISVERYLAICHPLKSHAINTIRRCAKSILVSWIVSVVLASPAVVACIKTPKDTEPSAIQAICYIFLRWLERLERQL